MNGRTENPEAVSVFSEQLHVAGVKVIAVAVGPKPETFLDQIEIIASSLEDILTLSIGDLNKIGQFLSKYICDIGAEISAEKVERKSKFGRNCRQKSRMLFCFGHERHLLTAVSFK